MVGGWLSAMEVALYNRQRSVVLPISRLRTLARDAVVRCIDHPGRMPSILADLASVEISLVSDRVIARVHRQFLNVPGATDVITFPHGEIVISATTAMRQARENKETVGREVVRYIVHGILHLHGHEDADGRDAEKMWSAQEQILGELWPATRQRHSP